VLKTCSLHCTHCQVTFKVLFLVGDFSTISKMSISSLFAVRQVV
jgi:hypothetical protein